MNQEKILIQEKARERCGENTRDVGRTREVWGERTREMWGKHERCGESTREMRGFKRKHERDVLKSLPIGDF
jgi:hypothetical protein